MTNLHRIFYGLFLASCFLLLSACSLRKPATAITADTLTRGMAAVETEEDVFVAEESALSLIKILDVLHYGDPKNEKFLGLLAKAYGNYAFGFAELEGMKNCHPSESGDPVNSLDSCFRRNDVSCNEWQTRAKKFYAKGRDFGISALSRGNKSIADLPLPEFEKHIKKFGKKDVPNLFWTAFNWGSFINMSREDIIAAADLPRVQLIVDRVIEIQPDFQCGVAYAFKGALLAGNPFLTGSKPETAKPYFEKALLSCNGAYLMTKVMYAEWYAKAIGDQKLFKDILDEVTSADASALPQ
ncbi:MAG: hypothetical protein HYY43_05470, partial [Deltaproteobacteria bacterium]|nr:hypothetical protein [Deltaproteobacteria bacterium]